MIERSKSNDEISFQSNTSSMTLAASQLDTQSSDGVNSSNDGDSLRRCNRRALTILLFAVVVSSLYRIKGTIGQVWESTSAVVANPQDSNRGRFAFEHKVSMLEKSTATTKDSSSSSSSIAASSPRGRQVQSNAPSITLFTDDDRVQDLSDSKNVATATEATVIDNNGPQQSTPSLPMPTTNAGKHAAESLHCRESVVAFVINATDVKDECEGLKKAFDKTCSNDGTDVNTKGKKKHNNIPNKRMRKLSDKLRARRNNHWRLWIFDMSRSLHYWYRYWFPTPVQEAFFYPEDEVVGSSWDDSSYLVKQDLDCKVHQDLRHQWKIERIERRAKERALQSTDDAVDKPTDKEDDTVEESPTNKTVISVKSSTSLSLPTSSQHVSEKVLSEALLLTQAEKIIEQVNVTVAAQDAATSSKALSDTSAAVTAFLNDPNSIEARTCCASILNVYHENCSVDDEEEYSDSKLFFIVVVMAVCGMVKSLIRHYKILWLPEAAGCIIVGVLSGYGLMYFPHHDISFDGNWFLRIMVPPIVFEAALSIDKRSFHRHLVPILLYAVVGTLMATVLTAFIVHRGSILLQGWCGTIPYVEALTFGALISSIDPIAVLSVLSNMGMTDTDTIYVVIFGESLLNDGVAIVLFQTLVHFLDETLVIDSEAIMSGTVHFFVVAFGSLAVGVATGAVSTVYYWAFQGCQTPLVEILMFVCWALLPYYICDGIGWSGIVSAVAAGIMMDLYIVGQNHYQTNEELFENSEHSHDRNGDQSDVKEHGWRRIFTQSGQLSQEARTHIHFVTEMISTMMETAIFAYLGLFLFSHRYHWNVWHTLLAISACCISRAIMIPTLSAIANWITRFYQRKSGACRTSANGVWKSNPNSAVAGVIIDRKMQMVLWFAGLRGAMSFALVEHIPLYDSVSQEGTRLKPELKAMTSACIMFTVFILGGYTYYMMDRLGLSPGTMSSSSSSSPTTASQKPNELETLPLIRTGSSTISDPEYELTNMEYRDKDNQSQKKAIRRIARHG